MPDTNFLDVLKARRAPVVKDGSARLPGSGFASGEGDKLHFADPLAQKIESDDAAMRHRFRISTPAVDRAGDVVLPRGCERYLDRYRKNPQVFLNHASYGLPIARSMSPDGQFGVLVRDEDLVADAFFHGKTEESEKTYELVKLGYLNAASIGFRPLKATLLADARPEGRREVVDFEYPGLCFQEWELLEWSIVGVPCNPEALDGMKSWLGKNAASDTPLHQALKAMLVSDAGKSVTVTVPAEPPRAVVVTETPVAAVTEVKVDAPFSDTEINAALTTLTAGTLTVADVRKVRADNDALRARLEALEQKIAPARPSPDANPAWKKVPAAFVRDVSAGRQDPVNPQLLGLADVRQKDYYSCGAAAAMAVGKFFGVGPDDLGEWKKLLGTTIERSTHPQAIAKAFQEFGLDVRARDGMTVADLKAAWVRGNPVICPVQDYGPDVPEQAEFNYGHYLAVVGVTLGYVFAQDSSDSNVEADSGTIDALGKVMVREDDWVKAWHDRDAEGNKFVCYGIEVARKGDLDPSGLDTLLPEPASASGAPPVPPGAKALKGLHKMYTCAMEHCGVHGELVEHPKTKPFLGEHKDLLDTAAKAVHKFGKKHYPDHFPEDGSNTDGAKVAPPAAVRVAEPDPAPALTEPGPAWTPELLGRLAQATADLKMAQARLAAGQYRLTGKRPQ